MRLAKICKGGCGNKPAMWIDGGNYIHNYYNCAMLKLSKTGMFRNTCKRMGVSSCCHVYVKRACWEWFRAPGLAGKYWLVSFSIALYNTITTFLSHCEGIFCLWSTRMVTSTLRPTTDFGERLGVQMVTTALEQMQTEILAINGEQEVSLNP